MERDEVQHYIDVTIAHSATIDVREVPEAPGFLRTIRSATAGASPAKSTSQATSRAAA